MRLVPLLVLLLAGGLTAQSDASFSRTLKLMGCRFDLTVVAPDPKTGEAYLDLAVGEIQRIERLISSWDSTSQTAAINRNAGIAPVKVDAELLGLIERSMALSRLTDGAFDITFASMDRVWYFDGTMQELPTEAEIRESVKRVGYARLLYDKQAGTVYLPEAGMKIGFGAIGKGYAADRARRLLAERGVKGGIINASGDLTAWGHQPDGEEWRIAITNPLEKDRAFAWLPVSNRAVVTSGNYEKYVEFGGVRYAHIIDPRTGWPSTGLRSVTILAPSAELADALATSVFVMGAEAGLNLIEQLPDVECILVDDLNQMQASRGLDLKDLLTND